MSKTAVCTLFENHFHYGFAILVNSLYLNNYRGEIYAGYRGNLPKWADSAYQNNGIPNFDCRTLQVANDLVVHFLKLNTTYHFTNYKSHFMLTLWNGPTQYAENLFYFDPDIINKCSWSFYEEWVNFGVALIHEITWNDMPANHPKRAMWAQIANSMNMVVVNHLTSNINAGFIGLNKSKIKFLKLWRSFIEHSAKKFNVDVSKFAQSSANTSLLVGADQDLLNLTAMCTEETLSEMGPEAMDFINGGWTMSHATGLFKPWKKNFSLSVLNGIPPSLADREYWKHANGIIQPYKKITVKFKLLSIKVALFISRFYKK